MDHQLLKDLAKSMLSCNFSVFSTLKLRLIISHLRTNSDKVDLGSSIWYVQNDYEK